MERKHWYWLTVAALMMLLALMSVGCRKANDETETTPEQITEGHISLRDMSEEECLKTLLAHGLELPNGFQKCSDSYKQEFAKEIVDSVLDDPRRVVWYSYPDTQHVALLMREVILEYEGMEDPWTEEEMESIFEGWEQYTCPDNIN